MRKSDDYIKVPGWILSNIRLVFQCFWKGIFKKKAFWSEFLEIFFQLPAALLKQLVPYLCETALSAMREGYLFGDFLFRVFKMGDVFSVLSLEGIFKLITEHNLWGFFHSFGDLYELCFKSKTVLKWTFFQCKSLFDP